MISFRHIAFFLIHSVCSVVLFSALSALFAVQSEAATPRPPFAKASEDKPNVLFISLDDLNDWIGCMGGHPQARTPNFDRLAASGVLFTNAHCAASSCNPSRTAIMTGLSPSTSGLYQNGQKMREVLPDAELLPKYFSRHGYWSAGSGKLLHYFIDAQSWDEYYPAKETEDPFPEHMPWGKRPKSLPRGGPWQYGETDWHAFDVSDEEFGGDVKVAAYIGQQLSRKHDQPFFLACGIYRPHEPWFNPKHYFDLFPLEDIQLPPGYKEDDLEDLPDGGKKRGPNRYFAHIQEQGQWKQAIQGYLASIAFADANLGRVLDALENGPNKDTTIVALWSDHGWHLGEKQHWQKYTSWRAATRVPLMIRVPKGVPGLPNGTTSGTVCDRPVNTLSLYPTLLELAGLPPKEDNDGPSLVPLLKDPQASWPHVSLTHVNEAGTFGLSAESFRYIHYAEGGEELYHIDSDPYEWTNLAENPEHAPMLASLRALAPTNFAPLGHFTVGDRPARAVIPESLAPPPSKTSLHWIPANKGGCPPSLNGGAKVALTIRNNRTSPVTLHWIDLNGNRAQAYPVPGGARQPLSSFAGHAFLATDNKDKELGHFIATKKGGIIDIPAIKIPNPGSNKPPALRPITAPPKQLGLDPFYAKCLNLDGYLICSSKKVNDYALREAAYLIDLLLAKRPDLLAALADGGSRLTIMGHEEFTTDVPEHASVPAGGAKSPDWWDRRARGLGGHESQPVASCGEENLLCFDGDPYSTENILIHEFAHTIHLRALNRLDPTFDGRLKNTWKAALDAGLWEGKYPSTAHTEYFAEGVQSWFDNNREPDHDHNHVNTRAELKEYDPALATILEEIFGDTRLGYVKPMERPDQGHMTGYNYSTAPTFRWPNRLKLLDDAVKREAIERNNPKSNQ